MEAVFVGVIVLAGLVALYLAYGSLSGGAGSIRRQFGKVPLASVDAAVTPGTYRLSGRARPLGDAPLSQASGRPFLAQDLRIVTSDGSEAGSTRGSQRAVDFLLDDGTGVALVLGSLLTRSAVATTVVRQGATKEEKR